MLREARLAAELGQQTLGKMLKPERNQFWTSALELGKLKPYLHDLRQLVVLFTDLDIVKDQAIADKWKLTEEQMVEMCVPGDPPLLAKRLRDARKATLKERSVVEAPPKPEEPSEPVPEPSLPPEPVLTESESLVGELVPEEDQLVVKLTVTAVVKMPQSLNTMLVWRRAQQALIDAGMPENATLKPTEASLTATWTEVRKIG
jgi:hypothetical protein